MKKDKMDKLVEEKKSLKMNLWFKLRLLKFLIIKPTDEEAKMILDLLNKTKC